MDNTPRVEVRVADENSGRQISLHLTPQELQRAQLDSNYLLQLVQNYYETEALNISETEDTQTITEDTQTLTEDTNSGRNDDADSEKSLFIWTTDCINLFLTIYEELKEEFQVKRHKKVYDTIAKKMREINPNYTINGSQCQSKMASLKKTYKKIKDHNNTSGNDRATWPYYERMQELFGAQGWVQPRAVASERGPEHEENNNNTNKIVNRKRKMENLLEELVEESKKRQRQKNDILNKFLDLKERQHKEKMEILNFFVRNDKNENLGFI